MLGDSACGKTKLVERLLLDAFNARVRSTYALTLHRWAAPRSDGTEVRVDIWDSAGQDRFAECHPSYYYKAHVAVLVFDVTRKPTYTHLKVRRVRSVSGAGARCAVDRVVLLLLVAHVPWES